MPSGHIKVLQDLFHFALISKDCVNGVPIYWTKLFNDEEYHSLKSLFYIYPWALSLDFKRCYSFFDLIFNLIIWKILGTRKLVIAKGLCVCIRSSMYEFMNTENNWFSIDRPPVRDHVITVLGFYTKKSVSNMSQEKPSYQNRRLKFIFGYRTDITCYIVCKQILKFLINIAWCTKFTILSFNKLISLNFSAAHTKKINSQIELYPS